MSNWNLAEHVGVGNLSKIRLVFAASLLMSAVGAAAGCALAPLSYESRAPSDGELISISVMRPQLQSGFFYLLFVACAPVIMAALLVVRRLILVAAIWCAGCIFASAIVVRVVNNLGPWTEHERVTFDNRDYVFLDSSFLQGQTMAIAEQRPSSMIYRHYHVLATNNGDSPRSYASIIRNTTAVEKYGQLYLTPDHLLVGVRYGNHCYLAYDLSNQLAIGHEDIEFLSPFVCLGPSSPLLSSDLVATIQKIDESIAYCANEMDIRPAESFLAVEPSPGSPALSSIQQGLTNPNPAVVAAAHQLLAANQKGAATLSSKVGASKQNRRPTIHASP